MIDTPIWEFAVDQEEQEDQDEATVRPWRKDPPIDPGEGMFVVRARFVLADGSEHIGCLTPPAAGTRTIDTIQSVILTRWGQVMFYFGVLRQTPDTLQEAYKKLERPSNAVFPIRFESGVEIVGSPVVGYLAGFIYRQSVSDKTFVEMK